MSDNNLVSYFLNQESFSRECFASWVESKAGWTPDETKERDGSGPDQQRQDSPGPPPDLEPYKQELGLSVVNFVRDQASQILKSSQECYPSPAKAKPAAYTYQSPAKAVKVSKADQQAASKKTSSKGRAQDGKKRVQLFKSHGGESSEIVGASDNEDVKALEAFDSNSAGEKMTLLEERFNPVAAIGPLKMVTGNGNGESKKGRRSLDSTGPTQRGKGSRSAAGGGRRSLGATFDIGEFLVSEDKQAAKKNRKKKAKSPSPANDDGPPQRYIPGLNSSYTDDKLSLRFTSPMKKSTPKVGPRSKENFPVESPDNKTVSNQVGKTPRDSAEKAVQPQVTPPRDHAEHEAPTSNAVSRKEPAEEEEEEVVAKALLSTPGKTLAGPNGKRLIPANPSLVEEVQRLDRLAAMYTYVMDRNLCLNVGAEICMLMVLLTVQEQEDNDKELLPPDDQHEKTMLNNVHNCVYFASKVLASSPQRLLRYLDHTTLWCLSRNPRLKLFQPDLAQAVQVFAKETTERGSLIEIIGGGGEENVLQSVRFCPGKDSKTHFPTSRNFEDFKKQRDLLYEMLHEYWVWKQHQQRHEQSALTSGRVVPRQPGLKNEFTEKFGKAMRELIAINEHPVNLSRLARLFRDQVLAMCTTEALDARRVSNRTPPASENINRSQQVDGAEDEWFFGTQGFFRDFILNCGHFSFLHHFRSALVATIKERDPERIPMLGNGADGRRCSLFESEDDEEGDHEAVTKVSSLIISLRTAARFLGLVESLQLRCNASALSAELLAEQVQLREQTPFPLDLPSYIRRAVKQRRLLVTLPWVVEFLGMLDPISLRCRPVTETLPLIVNVYKTILRLDRPIFHFGSVAAFALNVVLGDLFENALVPRELFFTSPQMADSAIQGLLEGETKKTGLDDSNLVHPDMVYACRYPPFLWEAKRNLLQFLLGWRSDSGPVASADRLARTMAEKAKGEKAKMEKKKVPLVQVKAVQKYSDGGADQLPGSPKGEGSKDGKDTRGCERDHQNMLQIDYLKGQPSDEVRKTIDFVAERIAVKLTSRIVPDSLESAEGSLMGQSIQWVSEHLVQSALLLDTAWGKGEGSSDDHNSRGQEELDKQVEELAASQWQQLRSEARLFMDSEVPRLVGETLSIILPDNLEEAERTHGLNLCVKRVKHHVRRKINKYINQKNLAKMFRAIVHRTQEKTDLGGDDPSAHRQGHVTEDLSATTTFTSAVSHIAVLDRVRNLTCLPKPNNRDSFSLLSVADVTELLCLVELSYEGVPPPLEPCSEATKILDSLVVQMAINLIASAPHVMTAEVQERLVELWSRLATGPASSSDALLESLHETLSPQTVLLIERASQSPGSSWARLEHLLVRLASSGLLPLEVLQDRCMALTRMDWSGQGDVLRRLASCLQGFLDSWAAKGKNKEEEGDAELAGMMEWLVWYWQSVDEEFDEKFPRLF